MLRGLDIIDEICRKYSNIPVIVNSTTMIPENKMEYYSQKLIIKHCRPLSEKTLLSFTKKGSIHLIEPIFPRSGKFVFWVDTDDKTLLERRFKQLESNIAKLINEVPHSKANVTISPNKKIITIECDENSDLYQELDWIIRINEFHEVYVKLFFEIV